MNISFLTATLPYSLISGTNVGPRKNGVFLIFDRMQISLFYSIFRSIFFLILKSFSVCEPKLEILKEELWLLRWLQAIGRRAEVVMTMTSFTKEDIFKLMKINLYFVVLKLLFLT